MKSLLQTLADRIPLRRTVAYVSFFVVTISTFMNPASALANGYATDDEQLRPGMIAALSEDGNSEESKVERASQDNQDRIIGVTTIPGSDLVTVVSGPNQAYVQSNGEVNAFVSNVNGTVETGDLLVISPLRGILMKADDVSNAVVVGIALEDISDGSAETITIQNDQGTKEAQIVSMRINLDYKSASTQVASTNSSISELGRAVTGRDVAELRVIAGLVIFLLVLVAEGSIIYGAMSSTITALGRNPMARRVILKEVIRVIAVALVVLGFGVLAIYAVLWV